MNRRFSAAVVACGLALGGLAWGGFPLDRVAVGQALPPVAGLPPGVQSATVEGPDDKLAISKFVTDQFAILVGTNFTAQSNARKALMAQLSRGSTPAYYTEFSRAWSTAATAALAKNPPISIRLNIAIVTQTLADNSLILDPEPLVVQLINDKDPSVSLWGIKAAKPLVLGLLQLPKGSGKAPVLSHPTVAAVVDAVKRHGKSDIAGIIASDAYNSLVVTAIPDVNVAQVNAMVPPLVEPLLDILEFRISQYKDGVPASAGKLTGPQNPGAEHTIGTFLSTSYNYVTPALQKRIVQDLVNLLTYVGDRAALYQNSKDDLAEIRDMLRYVASPLRVLVPSPAVVNGLSWFVPAPPACKPDEILDHTKNVYGLISKDPSFTWLAKPADVVPIDPPAPIDAKPTTGTPGTTGTPAR
jgi:hypothetical protein